MRAFGWNDLSHPPRSHLPTRARSRPVNWRGFFFWGGGGWPVGRQKALGKLPFNCRGNFNQCRITPPEFHQRQTIKGRSKYSSSWNVSIQTCVWHVKRNCPLSSIFSSLYLSALLNQTDGRPIQVATQPIIGWVSIYVPPPLLDQRLIETQ